MMNIVDFPLSKIGNYILRLFSSEKKLFEAGNNDLGK